LRIVGVNKSRALLSVSIVSFLVLSTMTAVALTPVRMMPGYEQIIVSSGIQMNQTSLSK
jgi:hypothetical protein